MKSAVRFIALLPALRLQLLVDNVEVPGVALVFRADVLDQLALQLRSNLYYFPRLGVVDRICNCDLVPQMPHVRTRIALDHMKLVRTSVSREIEPGFSIEADGVHHQLIAFPVPDGVTPPGGLEILGMGAAIGENLAEAVQIPFKQDHY